MKTKVFIIVNQGCVEKVFSFQTQVDIEVIDLDGDYREEGKIKVAALEESPAFDQVWP